MNGELRFTDKTGQLRPAEDYELALRHFEKKLVQGGAAMEPAEFMHGIVAIEALRVMFRLAEIQEERDGAR